MSLKNPKQFWPQIIKQSNWKDYILPNRTDKQFDHEGYIESQRLFYLINSESVIIDYGCGIGRVAKHISKRAKKVICLDINPEFIKKGKKYAKAKNIEFHLTEDFNQTNCAELIYSLMVLQHNSKNERKKIITSILRLLKPKGTFIANFPRYESDYYKETKFVHKFKKEEVEEIGKLFKSYQITIGNLPNYGAKFNQKIDHEYFLIAKK